MHRRRTIVVGLLALGLLVAASAATGAQPPPIPSDYSGTVTIGGKPAPDGATVQGKIDTYLSPLVTVSGGKYTFLIVGPLDPTAIGKTVTFLVNGVLANETSTFEMGTTKVVNLTVASAPAEPPVVPTPRPTPTRAAPTPAAKPPAATPVPAAATPAAGGADSSAMILVVVAVVIVVVVGYVLFRRTWR